MDMRGMFKIRFFPVIPHTYKHTYLALLFLIYRMSVFTLSFLPSLFHSHSLSCWLILYLMISFSLPLSLSLSLPLSPSPSLSLSLSLYLSPSIPLSLSPFLTLSLLIPLSGVCGAALCSAIFFAQLPAHLHLFSVSERQGTEGE